MLFTGHYTTVPGAGVPKQEIQALMTHSTPRATAIYLEGGIEALTDADYVPVTLPVTLAAMLKVG